MSQLLLDHTGAHIILDQPPNVIHIAYEFGRAFHRKGAWPRQLDGDALPQPTRPAREDEHTVGQKHRLVDLVGDEQDRLAASFPDAHELRLHDLAGLRVERRERLVHQQDLWVDRQRAREIDPLAHAARELARMVIFESLEADELQELQGALPFDRTDAARDLPPDDRVCEHRAPRQEIVGLKHETAVAARTADRAPVEPDLTGACRLEARDDAQKSGLATTGRADDGKELAALDHQI